MTIILGSDISFTLSGGENNLNHNLSLGGESSTHPIIAERLFSNVSDADAKEGKTDYRCFYINNDSEDSTLWTSELYFSYKAESEIQIELGFITQNEQQNITIQNVLLINGGSFNIAYTDIDGTSSKTISWNASVATWAGNLQTSLRTIEALKDVVVTGVDSGSNYYIFTIVFTGTSGNRFHEMLALNSSSLTTTGAQPSIAITRNLSGGPVNYIPDEIPSDSTAPASVVFSNYIVDTPYSIGNFKYLDSVPVWVKRIVPADTNAIDDDGFTFRLTGETFGPVLTPTFGSTTATANGFTVQISNYYSGYTWAGTATASGTVVVSGSGLVTVTGVAAATSSTAMITTTRSGYVSGSATVTATSLLAARTPTFGATAPTAAGFTVQISNYDALYTWAGTATASGTVVVSGSGLVTVTGVAVGVSSTATITTTRSGYAGGTAPVTETSGVGAALAPTFGATTPTTDGFAVVLSNYNAVYTWDGTATASGSVATGLVAGDLYYAAVTGVAPGTSSTATITTTRDGYAGGTAHVTETSVVGAALTPTFESTTSTIDGFTVQISNYNAAYTWSGTATASGTVVVSGSGLVTVTGVGGETSSTATIMTTRTGYECDSATVTAISLGL